MAHVSYEVNSYGLTVRYGGRLAYDDLAKVAVDILDHCRSRSYRGVLIDVTGSTGDLGIIGRYRIGRFLARTWDRTIRLAVLVKAEQDLPDRFWETVTRNRGLDTGVFRVEGEAIEWLGRA